MADNNNLSWTERLVLKNATMTFLNQHKAAIIAFAVPVVGFLMPSIKAAAMANPHTALGVICGCIVTAWANPSFLSSLSSK